MQSVLGLIILIRKSFSLLVDKICQTLLTVKQLFYYELRYSQLLSLIDIHLHNSKCGGFAKMTSQGCISSVRKNPEDRERSAQR